MERRRGGNKSRGRGGFRTRGNYKRGGKGGQKRITFTHFFAVPLWDCVKPKFKDRQDKFENFIRTNYPEYIGTYKYQAVGSAHISVSMVDLTNSKQILINDKN